MFQVYERVGTVISVCRRDQKGLQQVKNTTEEVEKTFSFCDLFDSAFVAGFTYMEGREICHSVYRGDKKGPQQEKNTTEEVEKTFSFCDLFVSAFEAVKAVQCAILGMLKGYHFVNRRYTKEVPFPSKG